MSGSNTRLSVPLRALVVEDSELVRFTVRCMLEDAGLGVVEAGDAATALEMQVAWQPDIVITDILLPGENGVEAIHKMRLVQPDLKVIVMSGSFSQQEGVLPEVTQTLEGACVLAKPFTSKQLLNMVDSLLSRPTEH